MKDDRKPLTRSAKHFKFDKDREDWSDREIQMSQLYFLTLIQDATEKPDQTPQNLFGGLLLCLLFSLYYSF